MAPECKTFRETVSPPSTNAAPEPTAEIEAHPDACSECAAWLHEHCARVRAECESDPEFMRDLLLTIALKRTPGTFKSRSGGQA